MESSFKKFNGPFYTVSRVYFCATLLANYIALSTKRLLFMCQNVDNSVISIPKENVPIVEFIAVNYSK